MRKTVIAAVVAAVMVVGMGGAWAAMQGGGRGGHPGLARMLIRLDLTQAQKHDIAVILKAHRDEIQRVMEDGAAARKGVAEAVNAPRFDDAAVREAVRRASGVMEEGAILLARIRSEAANVLTPDQVKILSEMRAAHQGKSGGRAARVGGFIDEWIATYGK